MHAIPNFEMQFSGKGYQMNVSFRKMFVVVAALVLLSGTAVYLGCSKNDSAAQKDGAVPGSSYTMDCKMIPMDGQRAGVEVTVKGPAAKLAVILTGPNGEAKSQIIDKDKMISNCQTVQLPIENPQVGTYVLTVKTVEPEGLVCKRDIPLILGQPTVESAKCSPGESYDTSKKVCGYVLASVTVSLKSEGSLPVKLAGSSLTVDGQAYPVIIVPDIMVGQQCLVDIVPTSSGTYAFNSRHTVKGKLIYGNDNKSLDFEKEFVVPQNGRVISKL